MFSITRRVRAYRDSLQVIKDVLLFREIVLIKEEIEEGSSGQLLCDPDRDIMGVRLERWRDRKECV